MNDEIAIKLYQAIAEDNEVRKYSQFHASNIADALKKSSKNPYYNAYNHMMARCYKPTNGSYKYYGKRGIRVCDRWKGADGFKAFVTDMGERPDKHSLDRIDNNGNYEPSNCRWATQSDQANNRRVGTRNKFGYRGIIFDKRYKTYGAQCERDDERIGRWGFKTLEEAALAYNELATQLYGNKAVLNEVSYE